MPESGKKVLYTSSTTLASARFFTKMVTFTMSSKGTSTEVRMAFTLRKHCAVWAATSPRMGRPVPGSSGSCMVMLL